ncbi:MAG TPA: DUF3515 domain-containing protein [Marmoricola sp.]|nr:DUF3515 domain-containing protein [Marmoricola sp.]
MNAGAVARPATLLLPLLLVLGACGSGAVDVAGDPPAAEDREACRSLLDDVPDTVADLPARAVTPADGWGAAWGDPAIVLRCGVDLPEGFDAVAACTTVNGVDWYLPDTPPEDEGAVTITTVHREPLVELRLPSEHWPPAAAMVDLAGTVREHTDRTGRCL